jgi:hypothetical protein
VEEPEEGGNEDEGEGVPHDLWLCERSSVRSVNQWEVWKSESRCKKEVNISDK